MKIGNAEVQQVHLIGIGGMHMSAIAQILLAEGISVSGSDLVSSALTDRLETIGAEIHQGHVAHNLGNADLVVATAAAKADNAELIEAQRRGLPILARHEMVARLMEGRIGVAVAGTHGKTTTSSMLAFMLETAGLSPTYLLGGESLELHGNAAAGHGSHIVVEADEYAGAFLAYNPRIALVTNIESDHLDYYGSELNLISAFGTFMTHVVRGGTLIACADSPLVEQTINSRSGSIRAQVERYALDSATDWRAESIELRGKESIFTVQSRWGNHGRFCICLTGRHNVSNALGAIAAGHALGLKDDTMRDALGSFHGVHRRFELVGEAGGITIMDDYAHHPTEVRATLQAARLRFPGRRLVVVFQPHTFSRTEYLLEGFRTCFADADRLLLLQTFAAREAPRAGFDARRLADEIAAPQAQFAANPEQALALLTNELRAGDVCLTVGAGDVTMLGPQILEAICH